MKCAITQYQTTDACHTTGHGRWHVLANTSAAVTPMKPKKAADDGHKSSPASKSTFIMTAVTVAAEGPYFKMQNANTTN